MRMGNVQRQLLKQLQWGALPTMKLSARAADGHYVGRTQVKDSLWRLRRRGYVVSMNRQWCLTPKGLLEAAKIRSLMVA